jgi:hypothetical protein
MQARVTEEEIEAVFKAGGNAFKSKNGECWLIQFAC